MLEEIIRLNNEGAALVLDNHQYQGNSNRTVILKHALQQFHTAIRSTLKLREYCDQQQPCYPHSSQCEETTPVMIDLTGLWYTTSAGAPLRVKERPEETSRSSSTGTDHAYYVYQQPLFLRPQAILKGCSTTTNATSGGHVVRAILQLTESVLLMNAALACYQLGQQHKQVANGADSWRFFKNQHTNSVFFYSKALPLYVRAIHYLKGCYNNTHPRTANDTFRRYHESSSSSSSSSSSRTVSSSSPSLSIQLQGVDFVIMAALNNLSWVCVELGMMDQAKGAQVELQHWQEAAALAVGETAADSSSSSSSYTSAYTQEQMEAIEEFLLNSTVLSATGFFAHLPACAA